MGMVYCKYRFVWASYGYPVNSHDSIIFSPLIYGIKSRTRNISPKIGKKEGSFLLPPLILETVVDEAVYEQQPHTIQQRYYNYRTSKNGDGGCFWAT